MTMPWAPGTRSPDGQKWQPNGAGVAPVLNGAKRWDGSAWVTVPLKMWNGAQWAQGVVKTWTGSAWKEL